MEQYYAGERSDCRRPAKDLLNLFEPFANAYLQTIRDLREQLRSEEATNKRLSDQM